MAYLHCIIEDNLAKVEHYFPDSNPTPDEHVDFTTGDITVTDRYPSGESFDFDPTIGTTITSTANTSDTIIQVADTSNIVENKRQGFLLDNGRYHWDEVVSVDSATQITISHGMPSTASSGNQTLSLIDLEGTNLGSLVQNFKVVKRDEVTNKSLSLSESGALHNGNYFDCSLDGIHYTGDAAGFIGIGIDLSGYPFPTTSGEIYIIEDNTDAEAIINAVLTRINIIYGTTSGQAYLLDEIGIAANTQAAMDAIIDTRT